ncbi:uncharacterized protein CDAR_452841 [Caerostris darwini]|uniref:Uncharacterized protein n=1 Tax=Caerostris darwini TaxID=1538125 RepID=A0AAV4SGT5_9ARAC|nr:uncharacterized protein CDAR_452841 [Caerostris darwini]
MVNKIVFLIPWRIENEGKANLVHDITENDFSLMTPPKLDTVRSKGHPPRFCVRALATIIDERSLRSVCRCETFPHLGIGSWTLVASWSLYSGDTSSKWTPAGQDLSWTEVLNAKGKKTKRSKPLVVWDCGQSSALNVSTGPNRTRIPRVNSLAYASSTLPHFSLTVTRVEGIRFGALSPISLDLPVIPIPIAVFFFDLCLICQLVATDNIFSTYNITKRLCTKFSAIQKL